MLDKIFDICGWIFITMILCFITFALRLYIEDILKKQKKIKCLCHHEYEPDSAFYCPDGIEYEFKCRKCGKKLSVQTVTGERFNWIAGKKE